MKITKQSVGHRIFSLIGWGACAIFFASAEAQAARCTNLNFDIGFAEHEVDITGKPLGYQFASFSITNFGAIRCDGSYDQPHHAGGFVIVQTGLSPTLVPQRATASQISIADSAGRVGLLSFPTAAAIGFNPVLPHLQNFILERKMPGVTEISVEDVLGAGFRGQIYTAYNDYQWHNEWESGSNITVNPRKLRLIYRPTCSASVNNVDFGTLTVDDIMKGVTKPATVDIDCNDLLLAYSIKVSSTTGADNNVVLSNNDTVGYRLAWGDLSPSGLTPSYQPVALNNVLSLDAGRQPSGTKFSIPINVTPVSRALPGKDIKPGKSDSAVNIELIFK
ncbi:fimbrial protein [Salmonella enterica subsp. enterica serovar Nottingham]|nr:hypothetical protein [Salmonella enterica subsp. enterica serovar Nottingham]EJX8680996.1 hypothetical protein [Salmonella enterica]ECB1784137.1 hypothetical protein [Salmonella enterica subsp. enterica serovar Nottingham]EDX6894433.1 fimbrial protein [Salmonella enterica subsp. enterica serovar Nottingham]EHG5807850.1 fimbrial protein [Salmonella enterica subsp. enterica serovar Nottingham]